MTSRRGWAAVLSILMIGMFSLRAEAQTEAELETARATFMEGVELSGDAQWAEAAQRFREVLAVRSTAQVQYNLGLALSHTDALVEAAELLRAALDSDELDRRRARDIRRLLEELEPRLARITVRTMGDEAGANVTLDGEAVGLDQIGTAIPVDPGAHTLEAQRDGISVDRQEVTLEEGESRTVTLATQAGGVVDPELLHPVATDEDEGGDDIWLWTAIGAGAGVVVLGIVIGVAASAAGGPQPYRGNLEPGFLEIRP